LVKSSWSWPFGRVDLSEDEILAYTPVFLGRWVLRIPYDEIISAAAKQSRIGGGVRLQRTASRSGDVTIVTSGDKYLKIADLLRGKGVHVTEQPRFVKLS
jgi:hypothetical protein